MVETELKACTKGYAGLECRQSTNDGKKCHCKCDGENHGTAVKKAEAPSVTSMNAKEEKEVKSKSDARRLASMQGTAKPKTK